MASYPSNNRLALVSCELSNSPEVCGMSPVTDLALNLSSLSTSLASTPCRRISWSDPYCDESKPVMGGDSPYVDSPMFQDERKPMSHKVRTKSRLFKAPRKIPFSFEDDKENAKPISNSSSPQISLKKSCTEIIFDSDSQDSGYSGGLSQSENNFISRPETNFTAMLSDEESEDGFESILEMDTLDKEDHSRKVSDTMTSLFSKPFSFKQRSPSGNSPIQKKLRMPIRRCLSIEMDNSVKSAQSPGDIDEMCRQLKADIETGSNSPKSTFKRPDPPNDYFLMHSKRRKSSPGKILIGSGNAKIQRSYSETEATIMHAIQKSDSQPELIGDCSKSFSLPMIKGRHEDLKSITSGTLIHLLDGRYREVKNYTIVDCRYPYEYEAGHIKGSKNIFTREDILETFLSGEPQSKSERNIIIFHCEFSSERAPTLCRFLRNKDREQNEYPQLHQPEIYLLDGGYKAFFSEFKEYCEPQSYKPMAHKDHGSEMRQFRAKSKSWGGDCRTTRTKFRSGSRI